MDCFRIASTMESVFQPTITLAAALTAWTQVRRNDELSKSYGL